MSLERDFDHIIDVSSRQNIHGRSYCNLCNCVLTLGENSDDFIRNFNIHANGRKHQHCKVLKQYNNFNFSSLNNKLITDETENNVETDSFDWEKDFDHNKLKDHGILINKNNNSVYCSFCRAFLPQLSSNINSNKYNIKIHIEGTKHIKLKLFNICETGSSITSRIDENLFNSNNTSKTFSTNKIVNITSVPRTFEWEKDFDCNKLRKDYGIVVNQSNNTIYCYFCSSFLPQLSDDVNSNIYNIKTHIMSKKHIKLQLHKKIDETSGSNSDSTSKNFSSNEIFNITSDPSSSYDNQLIGSKKNITSDVSSSYDNQLVDSKKNKNNDERIDVVLKSLNENLLFNRDYLTYISKLEYKCSLCNCNIRLYDHNNKVLLHHLYSSEHLTKLKCIEPKHYFISVINRQINRQKFESVKVITSTPTITISCDNQSSDIKDFNGSDKKIDFIFKNTDEKIIFNRNYITYISNSVFKCTLCSCDIKLYNRNSKFLLDHLYGYKHINKLRKVNLSYAIIMTSSKLNFFSKKFAFNKVEVIKDDYMNELNNITTGNKYKNTINEVGMESDSDYEETDKKNTLFLRNLFSYFIPQNLQPIKDYISCNSDDDFFCSVCNDYCLTEGLLKKNINCVNFSKILVDHYNTDLHTMNMHYQLNYIDRSDFVDSDYYDFLIKLLNEIPNSIDYFNINDFIMIYNDIDIDVFKIKCKACSTLYTVDKNETSVFNNNVLFKHIVSNYHKNNSVRFNDCNKVKNNLFLIDENKKLLKKEKYVTKDVLRLIEDEFEDDKTFLISYKSKLNQLVCKICLCKIYFSSDIKIAKINIIEHLNGKNHEKLKKYEKINQYDPISSSSKGDLMEEFLKKKCEYRGQKFCDMCVKELNYDDNRMHFKSEKHFRNCYKKGDIFLYLCKRFSIKNKEIQLKTATKKTISKRTPTTVNTMIKTIFNEFPSNLFKHCSDIIVNNHDSNYVLCRICYCEFKIINYNNLKNTIYFHISSRQHNLNFDEKLLSLVDISSW